MPEKKTFCLLALPVFFLVGCGNPVVVTQKEEFRLKNGLQIVLHSLASAKEVGLTVLYDVGEAHDPPSAPGLGNLIDHLYMTSASDRSPVRTIESLDAGYPSGWKAHTGWDHSVFALTFPRDQLKLEIQDAADRMGALKVEQADLEREVARLKAGLQERTAGVSELASLNRAVEAVLPERNRRTEDPDAVGLETVRTRLKQLYTPNNAVLVLAGAFDTARARKFIEQAFGGIAPGQAVDKVPMGWRGEAPVKPVRETAADGETHVTLALAAPWPGDPLYPAFIVLTTRIHNRLNEAYIRLSYPLLGQPEAVTIPLAFSPGVDPQP
ncbi:MAG: insulinase family protein, partial [Verrucomicrobiota bacterium]